MNLKEGQLLVHDAETVGTDRTCEVFPNPTLV